jgi:beta-lactamase regulating signal transducer with metallopeptidase domain
METNKFYLWLTVVVSCALLLMVMSLSTCTMYTNSRISKVIIAGANPIEAKIAFSSNANTAWITARELGRSANGGK